MVVFNLIKLQIKAKALENIELPEYSGNVFRGNFGQSFKEVACLTLTKDCQKCEQHKTCPYFRIFETDYPEDTKSIKRLMQPPKPYIIEPPPINLTSFEQGKDFKFNLTLIGYAIEYLPYFIFTFKEMGKGIGKTRGKFIVEDVLVYSSDSFNSIFKSEEQRIINVDDSYHIKFNGNKTQEELKDLSQLNLKFITPINIVVNKSSKHNLDFQPLFSRLISRINALSLLYCGSEFADNYMELIEKAKDIKTKENSTSWYQFKKYSSRQQQSLVAGGYLGEILYEGDFADLIQYMQIGEFVHAGKNTTLGFGRYEIVR